MVKEKEYVGELIRREIKKQKLTNGYVIARMVAAGIEMSDSKFSNKIYGERDTFNEPEVAIANETLGTNFKA